MIKFAKPDHKVKSRIEAGWNKKWADKITNIIIEWMDEASNESISTEEYDHSIVYIHNAIICQCWINLKAIMDEINPEVKKIPLSEFIGLYEHQIHEGRKDYERRQKQIEKMIE